MHRMSKHIQTFEFIHAKLHSLLMQVCTQSLYRLHTKAPINRMASGEAARESVVTIHSYCAGIYSQQRQQRTHTNTHLSGKAVHPTLIIQRNFTECFMAQVFCIDLYSEGSSVNHRAHHSVLLSVYLKHGSPVLAAKGCYGLFSSEVEQEFNCFHLQLKSDELSFQYLKETFTLSVLSVVKDVFGASLALHWSKAMQHE